jgi:Holliday junction resolvase RusA-like endonuclease
LSTPKLSPERRQKERGLLNIAELAVQVLATTDPDLILPIPVSDNERLTVSKYGGKIILAPDARKYIKEIRKVASLARERNVIPFYKPGWYTPVIMFHQVYFKDKRRDCSNIIKILKDALEGGTYDSDRAVITWAMPPKVDKLYPRLEVWFAQFTPRV